MIIPVKPWRSLLLVGPTGAGKSPLGAELERRGLYGRRCVHFDFGANLRSIAADPGTWPDLTAEEVADIRDSLATGALFEDRDGPMVITILEGFLKERAVAERDLLVLNGLPRHRDQAEGLAGIIAVEAVVELDADATVVRARMRLDPDGDRAGRLDDSPGAVERRLADYRTRSCPLVDHFFERGARVLAIPVTATMTAGKMFDRLAALWMEDADRFSS